MTINQRRKRKRGETKWYKPRRIIIHKHTLYGYEVVRPELIVRIWD